MATEATLSGKKALDTHLDSEFVFLAQFIRFYKDRVPDHEEPLCTAWLQRLLTPSRDGTAKMVRNTYLAELLLAMQSGKLDGPFAELPPEEPLPAPDFQPRSDTGENGEPCWLDTVINAPVPGDEDADERTYIATEVHPDGEAAYAYLAVSTMDHNHWIDPFGSENESTVIVTPPPSYAGPTACESCSSVNPIPEDYKLPCTGDLTGRCRRNAIGHNGGKRSRRLHEEDAPRFQEETNPLIHFYDELLRLVDSVQRTGRCSDDAYLAQLLRRLEDQAIDPNFPEMSPEQLQAELLRRLKAKLLTRREQAMRGRTCPQPDPSSPEDIPDECPLDLDLSLDEELWESAARTELSPTNMMLLGSIYPSSLVNLFVNTLIRERCSLIGRLRAEHEVLVSSLRTDVQKDIKESLDRFREARALWVLLLRATEELQHIRREDLPNAPDSEKGFAIRETVREIRDAMVALDEEGRRGANLANQLVLEHQELLTTEKEGRRHAQLLLEQNDSLRTSLQAAQLQESEQRRRIDELQRRLTTTSQTI